MGGESAPLSLESGLVTEQLARSHPGHGLICPIALAADFDFAFHDDVILPGRICGKVVISAIVSTPCFPRARLAPRLKRSALRKASSRRNLRHMSGIYILFIIVPLTLNFLSAHSAVFSLIDPYHSGWRMCAKSAAACQKPVRLTLVAQRVGFSGDHEGRRQ